MSLSAEHQERAGRVVRDAMENRVIDRKIAVVVMGFDQPWCDELGWNYEIDGKRHPLPHYSTDVAAAFMVVEAMRAHGRHFLFMRTLESDLCIASFYLGPHDREDSSRTDTLPARAICRAALAALRERTPV